MPWSVAQHDTIPNVDLVFDKAESHTYLTAFLNASGDTFEPPYTSVREQVQAVVDAAQARQRRGQAPRADVGDSRIRTWKSVFEDLGLLRVDSDTRTLELTPLGNAIKQSIALAEDVVGGLNDRVAQTAIRVLNRHTLRNPLDNAEYPDDSDLKPFRAIWQAMRQLDNRLHWEELNRVLMHVTHSAELPAAIAKIAEIRESCGGVYEAADIERLGEPAVADGDQTKRRVTPWLTRAGFGGVLVTADDDERGYRTLIDQRIPPIDEALATEPITPPGALESREAYLEYLTAEATEPIPDVSDEDRTLIERVTRAVEAYGGSKIICLSGLPGTGKTRLARLVSLQLTGSDTYRFREIQFHETTSYDDFVEGFVPRPNGRGFELKPKTLREMNKRAHRDPRSQRHVLLIEELTRANVHSVLGELLTYIEHRSRPFVLALSQQEISISPNLCVIATMNPRDRTALTLDDAIRRRLHVIALRPSVEMLRAMLDGKLDPGLLDRLASWFRAHLAVLPFGHGIFAEVRDEESLAAVWNGTAKHFLLDIAGDPRPEFSSVFESFPWGQ